MVESAVQSSAEIVVGSDEKKLIRVLHVDDELGLLNVTKQCLELQGPFQVDTAGSVEEALNKLKEKEYDAVVSDYQMPGKDGLEFLEMLRKNGNTIPFIMFTGKGREEVAVKAWSLGADHYVNKTGDPETVYCELAHCLRSTVEKRFAETQMKETVQRLQTIYQNAVEGITYVDAEENIVYANKAFADIVGYEQDQLAGMNLHKIVDDENWAKIENETQRRRHGKASRYEAVFRRGDGTVRNALISGAPLLGQDGRFAGTVGIVLDITESKKAGESVRASEERYRSYIEVTGQLGWTTNANGEVEEDIPVWRKYTGQSYEEAKGWGWTKAIHPDDLEHTEQAWEKAVAEKSSYEVEYRMRRYDGVYCYFLARGVPVLEKDGKIREWVGTCIDITERKKAEEALKDSEEKFRNLAEKSPNMIFINQKGRVVYANRKAEDSMGYTGEEFCSPNFNFLDLIAEESKELVKSSFSRHTRGDDVAPYEYKLITKEGRTIDTIINSQLTKYDGEPAILGVVTDITDRRKPKE
jgi:PAS domain S-box-containing protein